MQALSGMIGRKAAGGSEVCCQGQVNPEQAVETTQLECGGGIPSVAVKCVEMGRTPVAKALC